MWGKLPQALSTTWSGTNASHGIVNRPFKYLTTGSCFIIKHRAGGAKKA